MAVLTTAHKQDCRNAQAVGLWQFRALTTHSRAAHLIQALSEEGMAIGKASDGQQPDRDCVMEAPDDPGDGLVRVDDVERSAARQGARMRTCAQYLQPTRARAGDLLMACSRHAQEQLAAIQAWHPETDLSWSGVWSQKLPWLRNMPSRSRWLNCPWSHTSGTPSSRAVCQASRKMVMLGEYLRRIRPAGQRDESHARHRSRHVI